MPERTAGEGRGPAGARTGPETRGAGEYIGALPPAQGAQAAWRRV
jgi:hypothetical protein